MRRQPVRAVGGPLDGGIYEICGEPGSLINLSTAAGVRSYQFAISDQDDRMILNYIGPATNDSGPQPEVQGPEASTTSATSSPE